MFCKWCGLESETSDICSWCRRPFSATASSQKAQEAAPAAEPPPVGGARVASPRPEYSAPSPPIAQAGGRYVLDDEDLNPLPFAGPLPGSVTPTLPRKDQPAVFAPPAQAGPPSQPPQASTPSARPVAPEAPSPAPPKTQAAPEPPAKETPQLLQIKPTPAPPSPPSQAPPYRPSAPRPSPPSYTPPQAKPNRGATGYTFVQPRQPTDSRPPLEPIPIKGAKPPPGASTPPTPTARPETPPGVGPVHPTPSVPTPPIQRTPSPVTASPTNIAPPTPRPGAMPLGDIPADVSPHPTTPERTVEVELGLQPLAREEVAEPSPVQAPGVRRYDLGNEPPAAPMPQAHAQAHTATVPRAERGFYCRWCGMMSDAPDICTWCKKSLRVLSAHPARITTTRHTPPPSKRGPIRQPLQRPPAAAPVPLNHAEPLSQASPPPVTMGVPQLGTFQAQKSKYYGDKVLDPISGTHYDADTGQTTDVPVERLETEEVNLWVQVPLYLAMLALLALAAVLVVRAFPSTGIYLTVLFFANFMAGMAMPVLRVVPYNSDDAGDLALVIALILILGPFAGGMLYGIICFLKQDANPAMVGVFISYLVLRIALDVTMGYPVEHLLPFANLHWTGFAAQWMPLATVLGWIGADPFRKPDE